MRSSPTGTWRLMGRAAALLARRSHARRAARCLGLVHRPSVIFFCVRSSLRSTTSLMTSAISVAGR